MKSRGETQDAKPRLFVIALGLAQGLVYFDTAAIGTALPTIERELELGDAAAIWMMNAFIIVYGAFVGIAGRMVEETSARRVLILGVVVFLLGSAAAAALPVGLIPPELWLVTCRVLQGVGAALITPSAVAMVLQGLPDGRRGRDMALFTGSAMALFAAAPLIGGVLSQYTSWRMVFLFTALIGPVALLALRRSPPRDAGGLGADLKAIGRLCWLGVGLALAIAGIIGALGWLAQSGSGGRPSWPPLLVLGVSCAALALGLWRDQKRARPVLILAAFKVPAFSARTVLFALVASFIAGVLLFAPHAMQVYMGVSPSQAGLNMLVLVGAQALVVRPAGYLFDRFPRLAPVALGVPLYAIGFFAFSHWLVAGQMGGCLVALALCGVGLGLSMNSSYVLAITTPVGQPNETVVGLVQTVRRIATALFIALIAGIHFATETGGVGTSSGEAGGKVDTIGELDLLVALAVATTVLVWWLFARDLRRARRTVAPGPKGGGR